MHLIDQKRIFLFQMYTVIFIPGKKETFFKTNKNRPQTFNNSGVCVYRPFCKM